MFAQIAHESPGTLGACIFQTLALTKFIHESQIYQRWPLAVFLCSDTFGHTEVVNDKLSESPREAREGEEVFDMLAMLRK